MFKILKEISFIIIFFISLFAFTVRFSDYILPYRDSYGCLWDSFKTEDEDSIDIMFLGSSLTYCDVVPAVIYEEISATSYVMAGPQLTMSQTYFYLKECLKTQNPSIVFIEATGILFPKYMDYSRINIGYMPYSISRIQASIFAAEQEERLGLLFPPYLYGSLWEDAFDEDKEFGEKFLFDPLAGYTYLTETVEQDKNKERTLAEIETADLDNNLRYVRKIMELCERNEIELIFYISPMYKPFDNEYYELIEESLIDLNIEYINFNSDQDMFKFNREEDFYDIFHLNFKGAKKFSRVVAGFIDEYEFERKLHDSNIWMERIDYIDT